MDQWSDELKKILQAGLGAAATGVEKLQEAVDILSRKGEPIYEQAKSAVSGAAGSIKKAVSDSGIADLFSGKAKLEVIVNGLKPLSLEELQEVRAALEEICARKAEEAAQQAADEAEQPAETGEQKDGEDDKPQE